MISCVAARERYISPADLQGILGMMAHDARTGTRGFPPFFPRGLSRGSSRQVLNCTISHVLNEQGTGYKYLKSIELKNGSCHLKDHPKISKFAKFESYWFKRKGVVHAFKNR